MEISNSEINSSSIVDILTLRYDPSIIPNLPKKTWNDFKSKNIIPDIELIENLILKDISKNIELLNPKKLCIALSGGVDSTLILSLVLIFASNKWFYQLTNDNFSLIYLIILIAASSSLYFIILWFFGILKKITNE